jgi:heavy metal sensor kinase
MTLPTRRMFSSVRLRLTLWYTVAFGVLLIAFSLYVFSSVSHSLREDFDRALLRGAETTGSYFEEFAERKNAVAGARDTIRELRLGGTGVAIYRGHELLASTSDEVVSAVSTAHVSSNLKPLGEPFFSTDAKRNKRLVATTFTVDSVPYTVAALEPMLHLTDNLQHLREIILLGLPAALVLTALGGYVLAGKSLEPVLAISTQAEHITAKNLNERLEIKRQDEFGRLAGVINELLSRLERSFRVMREFMADASHELRTPLAIIHGEADVSLSRNRTSEEYRDSLTVIRDNAKRMTRIVKDMLDLARADSGQQSLRKEELYLDDLVTGCCRSAQTLAHAKEIQLTCSVDEDVSFHGDQELLKRMAMNLVQNAIHYTSPGGAVSVKLTRDNGSGCLIVSDNGIGIPPDSVDRVFDRFYRVGDARTRADGGSGLGLSIVKLAAESHGGSVAVGSELGKGSTFTVRLPLHPAEHS